MAMNASKTNESKNGARNVLLIISLFLSIIVNAQQTISLGNLQFVLPNADATMQSRMISLKMSSTDIDSYYYKIIGGIVFTQTAIPDFDVNNISLSFSEQKMIGYVNVNNKEIAIPLDIDELEPIVNFADSEYNVVMTMYGRLYGAVNNYSACSILFHPAFLDNMLGLRLLQVDAMSYLGGNNWQFPISEDNKFYITDKEQKAYDEINKKLQLEGSSYAIESEQAYQEIFNIINGKFNSYIYTDIDQLIYFSISNNQIVFRGLPYYQFSLESTTDEIDALNLYYWYNLLYNNLDAMFNDESSVLNMMPKEYKEIMKAGRDFFFSIANQSDKTDAEKANELLTEVIKADPYSSDLITSVFSSMFPMWVSSNDITVELRNKPDLIRKLNPIVYREVDAICQWSALFHYIKKFNPASWHDFVKKVNSIGVLDISVRTPIDIILQ